MSGNLLIRLVDTSTFPCVDKIYGRLCQYLEFNTHIYVAAVEKNFAQPLCLKIEGNHSKSASVSDILRTLITLTQIKEICTDLLW